jgi:polyisoprenoid-binding protein YceI
MIGLTALTNQQELTWQAENGHASIKSDAPLEIIKAESHEVKGVIDPTSKSFSFSIRMNSFKGFNSEIQQSHFLENYIEVEKYPRATFKGKLIEDIPFDIPGTYSVRAKGNLEVHGVVKERIIRGTLTIRKDSARVQSTFYVPLADHGITIPKIVLQKIAEQIVVDIDIEFMAIAK